jgi:hypothetical protein
MSPSGIAVGVVDVFDSNGIRVGGTGALWQADSSTPITLPNLWFGPNGRVYSEGLAVNASGVAVGFAEKYDEAGTRYGRRPVRWSADGSQIVELGTLGTNSAGEANGAAWAINDSGVAIGTLTKASSAGVELGTRAVRWEADSSTPVELGVLSAATSGHSFAEPNAINNAGVIVGFSQDYSPTGSFLGVRAVRWDAGSTAPTRLADIQTARGLIRDHSALAINDNGVIVGHGTEKDALGNFLGNVPVRWDGSVAHELGRLGPTATAWDINSGGFAVGSSLLSGPSGGTFGSRAVYWKPDGTVVDLNSLIDPNSGWLLKEAFAISDNGWITGQGSYTPADDNDRVYERVFLMQVPEPSSLAVLGTGLTFMLLVKHRRSTQSS